MGVYIKGMAMPKNCFECIFAYDEWCYAIKPTDHNAKYLAAKTKPLMAINPRPSWCPLVELPSHGRLIDADALKDIFFCTEVDGVKTHVATELVNTIIDDAPTIIEADESDDDEEDGMDSFIRILKD